MNGAVQRRDIADSLTFLAKGGQGRVYQVNGLRLPDVPGAIVFKEYKPGQVAPNGLSGIIGVRNRMDQATRDRLDSMAAWPCRLVQNGSDVCGILMPRIPDSFFHQWTKPSGKEATSPREVMHLFDDPLKAKRLGWPWLSLVQRLTICRDLAGALELLHSNGLVFGDVNARNALFRLNESPSVMLVDCDAARKVGNAAVVQQLSAPDWDPPEKGSALSTNTDCYKLALFVLRSLSPGRNCSTNRRPELADELLDSRARTLMRAALHGPVRQRPTAATWRSLLTSMLDSELNGGGRVDGKTTSRTARDRQVTSLRTGKPVTKTSGFRRDANGKLVPND